MCADGISIMRAFLTVGIASLIVSTGALADGNTLAGSLWRACTRASDRSQFVITFYPGGGVGGGELQDGEVNPYVFDASHMKQGEWPGRWQQTGQRFSWSFPDQHMRIEGTTSALTAAPREADRNRSRIGHEVCRLVHGTDQASNNREGACHSQRWSFHGSRQ